MKKHVDGKDIEMTPEEIAEFLEDQRRMTEKMNLRMQKKENEKLKKEAVTKKIQISLNLTDEEVKSIFNLGDG